MIDDVSKTSREMFVPKAKYLTSCIKVIHTKMIRTKRVTTILLVAFAIIAAMGIGTTNVIQSAFAQLFPPSQIPGCTGDPHGEGANPDTGNPHQGERETGNPHIGLNHHATNGC